MINVNSLTPALSITTLSFITIIIISLFDINFLVSYMGFSQVLVNAAVILSVIVLRYRMPDLPRTIKVNL